VIWIIEIRFLTSIWGWFFSISLNFHTTGDSAIGFSSRKIGDVDESVVEGGEKVDNTEVVWCFLTSLVKVGWAEIGNFLFFNDFLLFIRL
jgi:hypothetical protein